MIGSLALKQTVTTDSPRPSNNAYRQQIQMESEAAAALNFKKAYAEPNKTVYAGTKHPFVIMVLFCSLYMYLAKSKGI